MNILWDIILELFITDGIIDLKMNESMRNKIPNAHLFTTNWKHPLVYPMSAICCLTNQTSGTLKFNKE